MKRKGLILVLIALVCLLFALPSNNASAADEQTATLTFDANKTNRKSFSDSQQIWEQDGIVFTNNKGTGSNIADYGAPVRLYANSEIVVEHSSDRMVSILFDCNSNTYANDLKTSIGAMSGVTVSVSNDKVTVKFANEIDIFNITLTKQLRLDTLTVTYAIGELGEVVDTTPTDIQNIVIGYYNKGVYTKKSQIYYSDAAKTEFAMNFKGTLTTDRTTYYNDTYLLMGDFDGGFDEINSGYRTADDNMNHFVYNPTVEGFVDKDYISVKNTSIADYYIALDDMIIDGYFNGWVKDGDMYTYTIKTEDEDGNAISKDSFYKGIVEPKLHDFLWFTAPCLEDSIFSRPEHENYITQHGIKLIIEQKNGNFGEYLSLRITVTDLNVGIVRNDDDTSVELTLSEARIYKNNISFDENCISAKAASNLPVGTKVALGKTITCIEYRPSYLLLTDGETQFKVTSLKNVSLNDSFNFEGKITKNGASLEFNTATATNIVKGNVDTIENVSIKDIIDSEYNLTQPVTFIGVIRDVEDSKITIADVDGNTISCNKPSGTVSVGTIVLVSGLVDYYNSSKTYEISDATYSEYTVSTEDEMKYQQLVDENEISFLQISTSGTDSFKVSVLGKYGSSIAWSANNDIVKVDKEGNVTFERGEDDITVTLTAKIGNASKTFNFTIAASSPEEGDEPVLVEKTATLSFANKAQRTEFTTAKQVWEQNGIKLINNKASSTNNVADYASPARFYAGSEIVIDVQNISKIVFDCNSTSYATALKNSLGTVTGATVTVSSDKVTVTFSSNVDSFKISKLTAQVRMDSISVTYLG